LRSPVKSIDSPSNKKVKDSISNLLKRSSKRVKNELKFMLETVNLDSDTDVPITKNDL
jgi:hypothetical protein